MNEDLPAAPAIAGLVLSDITSRSDAAEVFAPRFTSAKQVAEVVSRFSSYETDDGGDWDYFIEVSSALVRTRKRVKGHTQRRSPQVPHLRRAIREWTPKSRSQMVASLCELDYSALPAGLPAMLTLTYPADWQTVAPSGEEAKKHLSQFVKRYERKWGCRLRSLWKMEFQRRGAPHFHLFLVLPCSPAEFREWVSEVWADVVAHPDAEEREKHRKAGTGLDYSTALKATDPQRLAIYFSKHSAPGGGSKEYQNRPPDLWLASGSVGRFWGYWGLEKATQAVQGLPGRLRQGFPPPQEVAEGQRQRQAPQGRSRTGQSDNGGGSHSLRKTPTPTRSLRLRMRSPGLRIRKPGRRVPPTRRKSRAACAGSDVHACLLGYAKTQMASGFRIAG